MAKRKKEHKCEVSDTERCPTCGKKAVTRIRDVVCSHVSKTPFWVCAEHKKSFLKWEKGETPHYKEVKIR